MCDTSLVQIDPERATGEVEVAFDDRGEPRYRLVADRAWEHIAYTPAVAEALSEASILMFGTLAQRRPRGSTRLARARSLPLSERVSRCAT